MTRAIITLTTDFGWRDPYVAEMKAVILNICPNATIVDVTHEIEKFNIRMGAYVLASAAPYFPKDTIHVAVVDPSVGTRRHAILIQTSQSFFIGPDNGALFLAATKQDIQHIYRIANRKFLQTKISSTFHGRDIFASAAAHLANGISPAQFGPEIHKIATLDFGKIVKKKGVLVGEIMHVDGFGNIITNFYEKSLESVKIGQEINAKLKNTTLKLKIVKTYGEAEIHKPLAIIGSHNQLEISINQGNAAEKFNVKSGDKVILYHS